MAHHSCRRRHRMVPRTATAALAVALAATACGNDAASTDASPVGAEADEVAVVVVTTSIWADVVQNVACGGGVDIQTLIPPGGDPHAFEPSLADRGRMDDAALVVANGLLLEEGLEDTIDAAESAGTPVFRVGDHVDTIAYGAEGDEDHGDEDHGDEDHGDEDHADEDHADEDHADEDHADEDHADEAHADEDHADHAHDGDDPHVWFDPTKVSEMLPELGAELVNHAGVDAATVESCISDYQAELSDLDTEIADLVATVPNDQRKLVTSHDALGYFAERYGFEVIGTVIPAPSGLAETNPAQLEALATAIEDADVRAIFSETQHSDDDARALAERVGDVEVVSLFTGTLGESGSEAETYVGFLRINATKITDALG